MSILNAMIWKLKWLVVGLSATTFAAFVSVILMAFGEFTETHDIVLQSTRVSGALAVFAMVLYAAAFVACGYDASQDLQRRANAQNDNIAQQKIKMISWLRCCKEDIQYCWLFVFGLYVGTAWEHVVSKKNDERKIGGGTFGVFGFAILVMLCVNCLFMCLIERTIEQVSYRHGVRVSRMGEGNGEERDDLFADEAAQDETAF